MSMNQQMPPPPAPPSTLEVISRFLDLTGAKGATVEGVKAAALEIEKHRDAVSRHELAVAQHNARVAELNLDAREAAVSKREAEVERREQAVAETEERQTKLQTKMDRWTDWADKLRKLGEEYNKKFGAVRP